MGAFGGSKTCRQHGEYVASAHRCPVCDGADHGGPHPDPHNKARWRGEVDAGLPGEDDDDWTGGAP